MTNQLKNYTDQELMEEITARITNYSLEPHQAILPLITIACQYLEWYREKKEQQPNKSDE